ncbi:TetR/AcrR family transcriptional regulator [Pseudonocardia benzenivorans]
MYRVGMPRRTDSKARMVTAARGLFRERGYLGTAMSDVLAASAAPRGSVYFHFPGGKEELGTEVVLTHSAETTALINRVALRVDTPGEIIRGFLDASLERLVASGYRQGCAVAPIVLEVPQTSTLSEATRRSFQDSVVILAARLTEKGVPAEAAHPLAAAAYAALEGALIISRSLRSTTSFETLRDVLAAEADRLRDEAAGAGGDGASDRAAGGA